MEEEVPVLGFCDGEEGGSWRSVRVVFIQIPCNIMVGVLGGGEYGEEDLPLGCLDVRVRVGVCHSKEKDVPHNLGGVAFC